MLCGKAAKQPDIFENMDFTQFTLEGLGPQDMIYCDPPYLITTGSYNDGNRGSRTGTGKKELQLLAFWTGPMKKTFGLPFPTSSSIRGKPTNCF